MKTKKIQVRNEHNQDSNKRKTKNVLLAICTACLGVGVGIGIGYGVFKPNHDSTLTINSWVDFDNYFETHHDEYRTPNKQLILPDASQNDIVNYFFKEKRISGQNLLYSLCLQLMGNYSYSDFDTSLKLKTDVGQTSASVELVSDFEMDRITKRSFAEDSFVTTKSSREYELIKKGSFIKVAVSNSSIDYELNVTTILWLESTKQDYVKYELYYKDSIRLNNAEISAEISNSVNELVLDIDFGSTGSTGENVELVFDNSWYPDVISQAKLK